MINKTFTHRKTGTKLKVIKEYKNICKCLKVDEPKKIFWFREMDNIALVKKENLKELNNYIQGSLF